MLAAAYLFGTALAGVLRALCDRGDVQLLTYYLTYWQKLFAAQDSGAAVGLFLAEYLTVAGALTAVLLLGLSALGPLPVFLFVILYGIGTGLIKRAAVGEFQLPQSLVYLLLGGIPAAIAAGCLCLFGTSALQVCSRLHSVSFGGKIPHQQRGMQGDWSDNICCLQQYLRRCAVRQQGFYACSIDWDRHISKNAGKTTDDVVS